MQAGTLAAGARFGAYRLIRLLGQGGFAEVWEAESESNGRRVALKVLTELRAESARLLERFQQEGRLAASLASPRCVYVFDAGAHDGSPYIAMELVAGGTLAERIRGGPLPTRQAVDLTLDVLEGLETAQQAGILHRDVKPSNVFLTADGHAKIGDFGISKSLEVDSKLSQTGAFLGTPNYASPEQIAGEPLDLRSDLYSVGVMLYELVTGKLPFGGTNASAVLAQVLTREPVPFAQHGVAIPAALQRIILRMLAKAKEKRFQSYEQLRAALVPLSSRGLETGALARRLGAVFIDLLLFVPVGLALGQVTVAEATRGSGMVLGWLQPLAQLAYFTLTERYWGRSVGKQLLGLRVMSVDGATPSLGRVALRSTVFLLLYSGPSVVIQAVTAAGVDLMSQPLVRNFSGALQLVTITLLLCTMRRRNGYAGLHELASGTRVMSVIRRERAATVPREPIAATSAPEPEAYGPYRATGTVWRDGAEALRIARDEELHRDVWIHEIAAATALPVERLRARGDGSLPWLQRGTRDGVVWDAYGAPQGTAFERWAEARGGLGWREMRDVLLSLARELESRFAREGTAGALSPRHVWVEPSGRALALDFPVAQAAPSQPAPSAVTPAGWRDFLRVVAATGFKRDPVALPLYARGFMANLAGAAGPAPGIADFRAALEAVAARPAEVTRARRAGPFAVLGVVPLLIVMLRLFLPVMFAGMPAWYKDILFNSEAYLAALRHADSTAAVDTTARRTAAAVRVVFASSILEARRAPQISASITDQIPAELMRVIDSAAARYPAPDSQQVAAARTWLAQHVPVTALPGGIGVIPKAVLQSLPVMGFCGAVGIVLAVALRGSLLLGLFGIGVARADGTRAGRLRCGARALIGWSPLVLLLVLDSAPGGQDIRVGISAPNVSATASPGDAPTNGDDAPRPWLSVALGTIALIGAGIAVWRPTRGVAERMSGVVLVPK